MKGLKRTVRSLGKVVGHRKGVHGPELLSYGEARALIYLPACRYMLEHFMTAEVSALRGLLVESDVVLLDYETNADVANLRTPLSHASLIAQFITDSTQGAAS